VLAVIHFFLQSKLNEWEPTVMAGILFWLMGCRAVSWRLGRGKLPLWTVAAMSLAAGLVTALGEAVYYWLAMGVPIALVLQADLSLDAGLRPAWVVFAATAAVALLGWLRSTFWPSKARRLRPA
jgi:sulfoxide reductase heme-binding subunit YedZ